MINNWEDFIKKEQKKEYFIKLNKIIENEYKNKIIYPKKEDIYNALNYTDLGNIKVVILGQDPYHEPSQAHGLSFSVLCDKLPPSLKNIFKELESDLNIKNTTGNLTSWAKEGVLLLNTILTVEHKKALSHKNIGWEILTDNIIKEINDKRENIVFILWGNNSIKKEYLIDKEKHYIIKSAHPSPLSAYHGFFGSKPFSKTNNYLISKNIKPINWKIKNQEN